MIYPECKNYHTLNIDVQDFKMYVFYSKYKYIIEYETILTEMVHLF